MDDVHAEIDYSQVTQLAQMLPSAGVRIGANVSLVVRAAGMQLERYAKQLAPVDTGALRNSITTTFGAAGGLLTAEVGPTVHYGGFVEHGTSRMAPRPYLGPALAKVQAEFANQVSIVAVDSIGGGR